MGARRGEGQLVVLAGEAGIGKTRLARELEKRALKTGATVLWGGCSEADLALPYLPFVEAMGNFLAATDLEPLRQRLGPHRRELTRLFPDFDPERGSGDGGDPSEDKLRLFEAMLALLRIAAEPSGLLCVVEDLHWADASTRELLDYLTRRLPNTRIMVLATYRMDELHRKHPLLPMVQAWRRASVGQMVELPALRPADVTAMVKAIFDRETVGFDLGDFLHTRSEGNPFVVEELLKAALDRGAISTNSPGLDRKALESIKIPPTVRDMILMRVERLPPQQVQILRTAAVLGRSFAYSTLAAISGQDETTVKSALHTFVLEQLMEEDPRANGRYRFRHALTREAVYEDLVAPDRAQLHAQAAAVLQTQSDTPAIDLAHHLLAGQRWDEAIQVCIEAARQLAEQQAYLEAVVLLERVLPHVRDKLTRARILGHLGTMHFFSADHRRAQPHLEEGIGLLEECGQGQEAAQLRWCLGGCYWPQGRWDLAQAEWEKARARLELEAPSRPLAETYLRLAIAHLVQLEPAKALALGERAIAVAQAAGRNLPRLQAYNVIGWALSDLGRVDEALSFLERSYGEAAEHTLYWIMENARAYDIRVRVDHFRAQEAVPRLQVLARMPGPRAAFNAAYGEGAVSLALGEPAKARLPMESARVLAHEQGNSVFARQAETDLAVAYGALGRLDDARRVLSHREASSVRLELFSILAATIRVLLDAGDLEGALREAQAVPPLLDRGPTHVRRRLLDPAVEAFLKSGMLGEAEQLVATTRSVDAPDRNPYQARMEGRLALARGDRPAAIDELHAAAEFFRKVSYRLEESRTRRTLAEAKALAGDRAGAEAELRNVLAYADEQDAVFEGQCARQQLAALGVKVGGARRPATRGRAILTAREREIATLVARGRTNRQIAKELVIAERTVDAHVEHIRNRLDVHNRAEIAAWAVEQHLTQDAVVGPARTED